MKSLRISIVCILLFAVTAPLSAQPVTGWLEWRGPNQNGTSLETDLPDTVDEANPLWSHDLPGRGTAVIARYDDRDRLFALGYRGEGADIVETLVCLDAKTGKLLWERAYPDFLSDIIYERYSIGAPAVDADTGNVYIQTSPGLLIALDKDGNELWQHSLMEAFGRLTFPNGRTGAPAIDGDLVIVNAITSNWGSEGRGANRFYAFDKRSGDLVWSSDPGPGPPLLKDSSFSTPIFETRGNVRLFYAGTGDGYVVATTQK